MTTVNLTPVELDFIGVVVTDDFAIELTVSDEVNGVATAYDWTGATVLATISSYTDTPPNVTELSTSTAAGGKLTISLGNASLASLGVGSYKYDIRLQKGVSTRTYFRGVLQVIK